jgi:diguanylate cyclase (GGDEF)-like protein
MAAKKTILVVDDSAPNRRILCGILRADGYDTLEAADGQAAIRLLEDGSRRIVLLLLDIVMPVMNGYELLRTMNETGLIASVPVIVTTGHEEAETELRCLDCGASDFLTKPYNAELVRHRVRSLLRLCENAALINQLETDRLTGLYSKEFFYRHAENLLLENPTREFDLVYADIDGFKMINAHYGTAAGDELLKFLAAYYAGQTGEGGVCGRIGADIFGILKPGHETHTQEEVGRFLARDLKDAPVKGFSFKCGIYHVRDHSLPISDMCDRAKLALESIKNQYGVYYAMYDDSMRSRALRDYRLANCMEEALEKKQFQVYLQPKHSTETGAVAGAEALVRWNHPELGFIPPGEFIPLFEQNGFIARLDFYVWTKVCWLLRKWIDQGRSLIPISVNASRADFAAADLPGKIGSLVDAYDVPHEWIHFEVTESAYTDNPKMLISAVSALRSMGFKIEMDDFGSGYSSLNMLSELPIDILKLDMRFMQSGNDRIKNGKRNILSFVISLSK